MADKPDASQTGTHLYYSVREGEGQVPAFGPVNMVRSQGEEPPLRIVKEPHRITVVSR
jgi:hypothetical protein